MDKSPKGKLQFDVILSFAAALVLSILLMFFGDISDVISNIDSFNLTITTILGVLFTVLTILYTFESQFEENRAVKQLQRIGTYQNILEIFFLSVSIIGIIWMYTFALTIFQIYSELGWIVNAILSGIEIWGFVLLITRLFRCYEIFWLLNKAMRVNEND